MWGSGRLFRHGLMINSWNERRKKQDWTEAGTELHAGYTVSVPSMGSSGTEMAHQLSSIGLNG